MPKSKSDDPFIIQQVLTLLAQGKTWSDIEKLKIASRPTISAILKRNLDVFNRIKKELANECMHKAKMILASIGKKVILSASLSQRAVAMGILLDKAHMLKTGLMLGQGQNQIIIMFPGQIPPNENVHKRADKIVIDEKMLKDGKAEVNIDNL